eukprot:355473-Chlamydomonas_euryale.AAC.1
MSGGGGRQWHDRPAYVDFDFVLNNRRKSARHATMLQHPYAHACSLPRLPLLVICLSTHAAPPAAFRRFRVPPSATMASLSPTHGASQPASQRGLAAPRPRSPCLSRDYPLPPLHHHPIYLSAHLPHTQEPVPFHTPRPHSGASPLT